MEITASIIILNYNGRHYLERCLESLQRQTFQGFKLILVDNGSTDGSLEWLKGLDLPALRLIANPENLEFARGNNQGIAQAAGRYIVTLNNDTEADERWLEELIRVAELAGDVGMVASRIALFDRRSHLDSAGMAIYPDLLAKQRGRLGPFDGFPAVEEVLLPSACAALYRREMLEEVGLFDEDFVAYCEDTDLGLRGRLRGWRCPYAPGAVVYHVYSGTGGAYSERKAYLVERNRIWTAFKILPWPLLLLSPAYTFVRYAYQGYGVLTGRGSSGRLAEQLPRAQL
ncbi:MAG TPA: glycosyltransferase family 2 protein, partial [Candidatus Wunengus sp. YC63]|uniref:glycosyltransferase family 2 protein n=1 Tax=Candidatus Wunengus sp. YC63 TaxID=3367699 RepID=UPI00402704BC